MSRKIITLIAALVVLVLLVGGYYGSTVWKKKKAAAVSSSGSAPQKIGNLDASKVTKFEVSDFVLEKSGDTWTLTSFRGGKPPAGINLDQSQTQSVISSLATVYFDRVIDETPADLSVYGLKDNTVRATVTDSGGTKAVYIRGDMTPSRTSYYVMQEGDPKVYSVSSYTADNMQVSLDKIRIKNLIPNFDIAGLKEFHIVNGATRIDISPKPNPAPPYLDASFSTLVITSPYKLPRGVDGEALDKAITPLKNLQITDFIDDTPSSLQPYGLDKPARINIRTSPSTDSNNNANTPPPNLPDVSLDLLIGNPVDGKNYAKLVDAPGVFTVSGLGDLVNVKPFDLIDKFALILNIDKVDHLSISGGPKPLTADFQGKGDDAVYSLNGKKTDSKSFKAWYQAVIGLLADAEYPGPAQNSGGGAGGNITIDYQLNTPAGAKASITLVPYNRDFYSLLQEGTTEFLISRNQVNNMYTTADSVTYQP